jgi:hypothetical protein
MGMFNLISEYKKRQMINRLADLALEKITKRHLVKAFRKAAADKVFAEGDILNVSYTVTVSGKFTGKSKRR